MNTTTERPTGQAHRGVSLAKKPTVIDLRDIPEYFDLHVHAASAALYAGTIAVPALLDVWTGMSTGDATALLGDGTRLVYHPDPQRITAHRLCRHDRWHHARIEGALSLAEFAEQATDCTRHDLKVQRAIALGVSTVKAVLADADDTQPSVTSLHARADALVRRPAADRPKEHPQP
ncbi:hypothetical protein F3K34_43830 [Streptomyces sp. LBUM 1486]|uniref:hypothetical protein n=1 Tax=Streptomyces scabiei TaxID=1930 RepID=UPI001B344982|nr:MULTISPECIES: hypothetical protein [Streptomyces]MBP5918718.1 hypothetical protein [Streptomyces sp. LBUM 1486]MDX2800154.1 hypothetical protein [Streptomyces scabiei]MDX3127066.1 hypothetical protein [Streptomyces scabiei]MDX3283793.1 hypothetical protein [Streptomyces scabiei]